MALSVVMPALEMAQETGKLVSWLKRDGDHVRKGEMILEVETDKAVVEIEAAADGVLAGITAREGDVIPVGRTIAWLLQPGESLPTAPETPAVTGRRTDATPAAAAAGGEAAGPRPTGATRVSPKARRLAQEHGVDLASVRGSGSGGEILADDILAAAEAVRLKPDTTTAEKARLKPGTTGVDAARDSYVVSGFSRTDTPAVETVSSIGRLMAERTTESWTSVPHFFLTREVDATPLNTARNALVPVVERSHGVRITHTDLLVAAVGRALRKHPRMHASWTGDPKASGRNAGIQFHAEIDVAIAMAVEHAVVTAVVRGADSAAPGEIAVRRRDLTERARAGRLQPGDITGATFTISNLGIFGVDAFTAIIVPPQSGILAVGAIADRVVAVGGQIVVRPMMTLTLSADHRVIDGAGAAAFLQDVVAAIGGADTL